MIAGLIGLGLTVALALVLLVCLATWGKDSVARGHEIGWVKGKRSRW